MRKCIACNKKLQHGEYCNSEAGIDLCQKCSMKVTKHFIEGWYAVAEMEFTTLRRARDWITNLLKKEGV